MTTSDQPDSILHPRPRIYWHYPTADTPRMQGRPAVRVVKNLGWILANARYITRINMNKTNHKGGIGHGASVAFYGTREGLEFTFVCYFESYIIARRWVTRPSLLHATMTTD